MRTKLWDTGSKSKYKRPAYGYRLGAFLIEVGEKIAQVRPGLFAFEYQEALSVARSYMQSLVAAIPDEVLERHGLKAEKLIADIESMDKKNLLITYHRLVNILDSEGLLVQKRSGQPQEIEPMDQD